MLFNSISVQNTVFRFIFDLGTRIAYVKKLTFYYYSHNYHLGRAGATVRSDVFNLDITDWESAIATTLM